ncbi:MAG: methyltransferase domain-containing protein [Solirubrobacterales bacterium]
MWTWTSIPAARSPWASAAILVLRRSPLGREVMGEERDAHRAAFNRSDLDAGERARLEAAYRSYAADPARRRAWDAANPGNVALREEIAARLEEVAGPVLDAGAPVLDAGCGTGYWLGRLAGRGVAADRLHGVDMLADRVAAARRRVPGAAVRQADARQLPFASQTFGLVLLFTVLSSQRDDADRAATLREARRVTRPGGLVVVWDLRRTRRRLSPALLRAQLGPATALDSVTVAPPLARRLGRASGALYPRLARVPLLRTHWLAHARIA